MKNQKKDNLTKELSSFIDKNRSSLSTKQLKELNEIANTSKGNDTEEVFAKKILAYFVKQEVYSKIKDFVIGLFVEEIE